jgi:uncharacterized protein YjbJ (UPF0337 family)
MQDFKEETQDVQRKWRVQSLKLKVKYATLTDADLHYTPGKKEEMMSKLHTKLGKSKEQLAAIIAAL